MYTFYEMYHFFSIKLYLLKTFLVQMPILIFFVTSKVNKSKRYIFKSDT